MLHDAVIAERPILEFGLVTMTMMIMRMMMLMANLYVHRRPCKDNAGQQHEDGDLAHDWAMSPGMTMMMMMMLMASL